MSNRRRYHIIIDSRECDEKYLGDKQLIEDCIRKIAELAEMKILHGPVIIDGVEANPGITAFTIIDFSHISIHTFTKDREICVDVFSCKAFDYDAVKTYVYSTFKLTPATTKFVEVQY